MYAVFTLQLDDNNSKINIKCDTETEDIYNLIYELCEYITYKYNDKIVDNILNKEHYYLCNNDRAIILKNIKNTLKSDQNIRKIIIEHLFIYFSDYLNKQADTYNATTFYHTINIPGLTLFRLEKYRNTVKEITEKTIEQYFKLKDENEFINLLKALLSYQHSVIDEIDIVSDFSGRCFIHKENFCELSESYIKDIYEDYCKFNLENDDMILSLLISLAPKKIIIHLSENNKNSDLIAAIQKIFDKKVSVCYGCKKCIQTEDI